jgi:hypothetical protein
VALAMAAFLAVSGCSADQVAGTNKPAASSSLPQHTSSSSETAATQTPLEQLAVLRGQKGLQLVINTAERDAGGFLTVKGRLANTSESIAIVPAEIRGNENEVVKHGKSLGGATLVDSVGKKRYYVLRDTDGRPLTTSGLDTLGPGKSTSVFMQFPAPPATTTEVSFQLPTFEPATLKLS